MVCGRPSSCSVKSSFDKFDTIFPCLSRTVASTLTVFTCTTIFGSGPCCCGVFNCGCCCDGVAVVAAGDCRCAHNLPLCKRKLTIANSANPAHQIHFRAKPFLPSRATSIFIFLRTRRLHQKQRLLLWLQTFHTPHPSRQISKPQRPRHDALPCIPRLLQISSGSFVFSGPLIYPTPISIRARLCGNVFGSLAVKTSGVCGRRGIRP